MREKLTPPSLSITNILQALYEESSTIKMYVDTIASGRPAPFTLITKSTEHEKDEEIVKRVRWKLNETREANRDGAGLDNLEDILLEILDEAMILEENLYTVVMFKDDAVVDGSEQIVKGDKIQSLKQYAEFKGFTISIKKRDG